MKKFFPLVFSLALSFSTAFTQVSNPSSNFTSFASQDRKVNDELEKATDNAFKTHPDYGVLPYNAPCKDCYEVLQKRSENQRYFVKEGNENVFIEQTSYGDINYRDKNGFMRSIDSRLKPTVDNAVFTAPDQPHPVTINLREKYVAINNGGSELKINNNPKIYILKADGSMQSLGEPSWSNYTAGDNGVVVHNFYPGIDMQVKTGEGRAETFFIMNRPLNLQGSALVVRDQAKVPDGFTYDYSYTEKKDGKYEGALCINSSTGKRYFIINSPAAFDENSTQEDGAINIQYTAGVKGNYDMYIPLAWMNSAKRSYPVIIDPFVTSVDSIPKAQIFSTYNATCYANGCVRNINVHVPAACIITDITYAFDYDALGTCALNKGAWSITDGVCGRHFILCNSPIAGHCQGPPTSLMSPKDSISSCLPPPQCNSYTLPFIFTFYRCTMPSGNSCDFSCINAASPLVMTVTGRRLVVTTSNINICQGASGTLTATADSGLAPYSYKWYPGGLTGQSVTVSPNTTTTYTVTASTCSGQDSSQATAVVTVGPISAIAGPDTSICAGTVVQMHATGGTDFSWSPPTGLSNANIANPTATPTSTITYTVTATSGSCTSSTTVTINVVPTTSSNIPDISLTSIYPPMETPPYLITAGDSVIFSISVTGQLNDSIYLTGSSSTNNPIFSVSDSGKTILTRLFRFISSCEDATASVNHITFKGYGPKGNACTVQSDTTYTFDITVTPPIKNLLDTVPNVITPNGDHLNDYMALYHLEAKYDSLRKSVNCWTNFHVQIFNRWGEQQFESTDFNFHWDGLNKSKNEVPEGVYYYVITADFLGQAVSKKGTVNVIRGKK